MVHLSYSFIYINTNSITHQVPSGMYIHTKDTLIRNDGFTLSVNSVNLLIFLLTLKIQRPDFQNSPLNYKT